MDASHTVDRPMVIPDETLQHELEADINEKLRETQSQLMEHFDEDVHERLRLQLDAAEARLDRIGRWFWETTRFALNGKARFEESNFAFSLQKPPISSVVPGRYQLVRGAKQADMLAHAYRLNHPLGEWAVEQARAADTPPVEIVFNYSEHPTKLSVISDLVGKSGWLRLDLLTVSALDTVETLIFTAATDDGAMLDQECCEKLFMVAAKGTPPRIAETEPAMLQANSQRRIEARIAGFVEENQRLFMEERDKLEKWAEDKLLATEEALRDTKARIAQLKRDARKAASLEEQARIQSELSELQRQQRKQRQEIFDVEDEIIARRDELIDALQERLGQTTETRTLFTLRWQLV